MKTKLLKLLVVMTISITAIFALGLSASAETVGAFEVTGGTLNTDYTYAGGVLTIRSDKDITIANTNPSTSTTDRIVVAGGVSANITLAGVNIDVSSQGDTAAFQIADNSAGNVTITLADGTTNTLKSGKYSAGLQKNGEYSETLGKLTITGTGSLTATGGERGAGIGGGYFGSGRGGSGSNIKISGGKVTATGGDFGAGIGGGGFGSGSDIKISGGTVTATGGAGGAGIGGAGGSGSNIEISGGKVTATGGEDGAGIGGGFGSSTDNIKISGGTVTATGGEDGAGIGGSGGGSTDNIKISGGTVKASSIGCIPTDGTANATPVYLLELDVDGTSAVTINGKAYPIKHFDENKVYIYLPAGEHTIVKDGGAGTTAYYAKNADNKLETVVIGTAFTITGTDLVYGIDYTYPTSTGVLTILSDKDITIKNTNPSTSTTDRIEVADDVSANITLAGVNIDVSAQNYTAAFQIAENSTGNVTITLADGTTNTLKSGKNCAGLQKNGAGEGIGMLTICGTGSLSAQGGISGAGIGGGDACDGSNIEISGGTVTATGGTGGAGIGGGRGGSGYNGRADNIKISGGTVTATGGEYGAGIGGGRGGRGSNIEISGGTVTAEGGAGGAGIGGGNVGSGSNIKISGGKVTATGGECGAGIGGGHFGSGSNIKISGGTVTATGGENAAGIGGGYEGGSGSDIKISGGTVTATGGAGGAGIGGGNYNGSGIYIEISGGTVTATGGTGGAGIGGGYKGSADNITISGGSVKAVAGEGFEDEGTTYFPAAIGQGVQYDGVCSNGAEVTPTDGNGNNVYLLELAVDGTSAVTANGKAYPKKHFDENKVYIYLPAKTAQAPNEVTVGNETTKYCYINAKWLKVVDAPTFTPTSGTTFTSTQNVTIACATDGATIYYTTDGSTPTTASTKYTGAITITSTTTIKAIAVKDGMGDSSVVTANYTKNSGGSGGSGGGSGGSGGGSGGSGGGSGGSGGSSSSSSSSSKESPNIEGKNGKKGWSAILDVIEDTKEGEKVVIDMNDATEIPRNILSEIKGKDIAIVLNMDNGFIWTINGKDVENPKMIDMGVKKGTRIPVKVINEVTGESEYIEITLSHNGDFGFKAVLTVDMGKNNKGNFANLYYYNGKEMDIICSDEIDENGKADLTFTHASEYVIVIDDTDHTDLSAGESIKVEEIVLL